MSVSTRHVLVASAEQEVRDMRRLVSTGRTHTVVSARVLLRLATHWRPGWLAVLTALAIVAQPWPAMACHAGISPLMQLADPWTYQLCRLGPHYSGTASDETLEPPAKTKRTGEQRAKNPIKTEKADIGQRAKPRECRRGSDCGPGYYCSLQTLRCQKM